MNIVLVAAPVATHAQFGGEGLMAVFALGILGSALVAAACLMVKRNAPRGCPLQRHRYAGSR